MRALRHGTKISTSLWAIVVCLVSLILLSGVTGCGSSKTPDEAKKELEKLKKKKRERPFEPLKFFAEPNERSQGIPEDKEKDEKDKDKDKRDNKLKERELFAAAEDQSRIRAIKPGHWTSVLVEAKVNQFDFSGELISRATDNQSNPLDLESSAFRLVTSRSASLPKGQRKTLETLFFCPRSAHPSTSIASQLRSNQSGIDAQAERESLAHMPSYQYFMFVMARDANRYRYLKVLNCSRAPLEYTPTLAEDAFYYRIVVPRLGQPLALSTQPLCWTNTAYVVWDDMLATDLSPEQQQAMLDWLHWGGGLIISGPRTLDGLRGTFLDPYLPASASETVELDANALAELNAHWTVPDGRADRKSLQAIKPWSGIKLAKHADANFLPGTGELVVERRVGRGRVVATAFRLSEQELLQWRSFDSFFNACLLRRPHRNLDHNGRFEYVGKDGPWDRFDSELVSNLRIFTRDATDPAEVKKSPPPATTVGQPVTFGGSFTVPATYDPDAEQWDAYKINSGVGGWNDFSAASTLARQTLRDAAGISVPKREFVLWMVGVYLVMIVPVNWSVFRLLGRVEWAWLAVPVLAVAWGLMVIWLAQLDIGFARAEIEVDVLEVQNGFPRAHLTRYTALYSSLSTSYDVHFDDSSAVAQPFSVDVKLLAGQSPSTVTFRVTGDRQLDGYPVRSNSTGMVHSEEMFDLGGGIDWRQASGQPPTLENNTKLKLSGAAVLRRRVGERGAMIDEWAWLGDLVPGAKVDVAFRPHASGELVEKREQTPLTREAKPEGELSLWRVLRIAENFAALQPGDVRLVAYRDAGVPGMRVEPAASQARRAMLVVAHLAFAAGATPRPDLRLPSDEALVEPQLVPPERDTDDSPP